MPSVGYATIQIIPSVRGIGDELRRQLVGPSSDAGGQAGQAAGGGLRDKLKVGAAAAGAAAGALLVVGITKAMERANITSTLQAQLGTTGQVAAAQGKVAGKLYSAGVSGSFQEAADAIKSVVQAGLAPPGTTNKQLQAIATKASDVANVFGQDLGGVTRSVSQMMRTGLAKSSTQAFDLITAGLQSGADKGGDFLDTINEYSTQFRKAGLDGSAAIGLINQAIKAGARDSDIAADAIKEFSIRAVDGSDTTAQGFKMLGLNADNMAAKFAKGGKSANGVLDLTLDRLRGIKDPVKQSQAAVALFGTQAEDLGGALLAMDPSKAAAGLGKFGGAADKVGKTIHSGPSHEIEVFKRALETGVVNFIGGQVLPVITDMATWFNTTLLPPIRSVATIVDSVLVPALSGLWDAGAAVVGWLRDMGTWLIPIGIAVGGLAIAMNTQAIATAATTAVFSLYRAAILIGTAVTNGFAGAQALLNAVMNANPIVLIVTLLVALAAALVIAYQKSETFRNIVQGAWQGIQAAALYAWNNVLKPVFAALVSGFKTLGQWARWLWANVIKPVWNGIETTIITVWNDGIKPTFDALKRGVNAVRDGFKKGVDAIGRIWNGLKAVARRPVQFVVDTVYNNGIRKVWNTVAGFVGLKKLAAVKFAEGGRTSGGIPGKDSIPSLLMADEFVVRRDSARKVGFGTLEYINRYGQLPGFAQGGQVQRFADGGVVGWLTGAAKRIGNWVGDGAKFLAHPGKAWEAMTGFIRAKIKQIGSSRWAQALATFPIKMLGGLKDKLVSAARNLFGAGSVNVGGAGVQRWAPLVRQVLRMLGGPASALGPVLTRIRMESGGNPRAINNWDINARNGDPSRGLMQTIGSTFAAYAGPFRSRGIYDPLANIYAGVNYARHRYGRNWIRVMTRPGGYDSGGWLMPGATMAVNKTGQPEAVLTGPQWRAISMAAAVSGLAPGQEVTLVVEDGPTLRAYVDARADGRVGVRNRELVTALNANRRG